jgi:hypothetical protein
MKNMDEKKTSNVPVYGDKTAVINKTAHQNGILNEN